MAITDTGVHAPAPEQASSLRKRRRIGGRISGGHWLMIVAGLLAALVNVAVLRAGDETVAVAVAIEEVLPGQALEPGMFRLVDTRVADGLLAGLVTADEIGDLAGAVAATRIGAGEPLLRSALGSGSRDGLRTMSLPIDPAHAAGGRLVPGDRVDVIAVGGGVARYVAVELEVVAVAERGAGALGAVGAYHVTVALDAQTALEIALAMRTASIELVRSTGAAPVAETARSHGVSDPDGSDAAADAPDRGGPPGDDRSDATAPDTEVDGDEEGP